MKKRLLEDSFADIDDKYIVEALAYNKKKGRIIRFPYWNNTLSKVAAILIIVLCVGVGSKVVVASVKKLFFTEHSAYVGEVDFDPEEDSKGLYDGADGDSFYMDEDEITYGDDTVLWTSKKKISYEDLVQYEYYYDTYETAVLDGEFHRWFDTLPGEVRQVYIGSRSAELNAENKKDQIRINARCFFNGNMYYVEQQKMTDDYSFFAAFYDNKQNEREYVNKAGIKFVLIDDVREDDMSGEKYIYTDTLILDGDNKGRILFDNMCEEDIYEILDHFITNNEAVE